jgi:hypothetical protein
MKSHLKNKSNIILLAILLLLCMNKGHAADEEKLLSNSESTIQKEISSLPLLKEETILSSNKELDKEKVFFRTLNGIIKSIRLQKKEIVEKSNLLKKAKTEQDKVNIQLKIDSLDLLIKEQERSFELLQTGGLELAQIEATEEKIFDWQKDLLEILQPIMNELRELTKERRTLLNFENKVSYYQSQIHDINKALNQMARISTDNLEIDALKNFKQIKQKWQNQLEENNHLFSVAELQLDEMVKAQIERKVSINDRIKQFATGRGATLLISLITFVSVYFSLLLLWKGAVWICARKLENKQSYFRRIITLIYYTLMVLLSFAAVFYVLSIRNDQVLIGVAFLILIVMVLALKSSIPRYINELKILLNAGSVREGERITYNGIPMKMETLNFFSKLTNPNIPNLTLRLPLSELSKYISRKYTQDEPWFPCQQGDYVMLSDGTYGKVKCITFESVLISLSSGMSSKTYSTIDFLATNPRNLSQGFVVTSDFGIDYKYQQQCTTEIPELLCTGIRQGLQKESYGDSLEDILVEFAHANTSSLDYKIIALFNGNGADDYYSITRALQRHAVEVCNQQGWEIPFSQLVVHTNQG